MDVTKYGSKTGRLPLVQNGTSKPGPKPGNQNAATHGLHGIGWPKGTDRDRRACLKLKRLLADALIRSGREIGIVESALLESVARWERHSRLAGRWLKQEADKLSPGDKLAFSREIAKASSERDRAIAQLKLGDVDPWSVIDAIAVEGDQ